MLFRTPQRFTAHLTCFMLTYIGVAARNPLPVQATTMYPCETAVLWVGHVRSLQTRQLSRRTQEALRNLSCQGACTIESFAWVDNPSVLASVLGSHLHLSNRTQDAKLDWRERQAIQWQKLQILWRELLEYEVRNSVQFTWIVRARPDLFWFEPLPCIRSIGTEPGVYARYISVRGVPAKNLTNTQLVSFLPLKKARCTIHCDSKRRSKKECASGDCLVIEDTFAIVPRSAANVYFTAYTAFVSSQRGVHPLVERCFVDRSSETILTAHLLTHSVPIYPLRAQFEISRIMSDCSHSDRQRCKRLLPESLASRSVQRDQPVHCVV
mmetsp:Transcript_11939/g.25112  ORF Transcript_11939/g.25112 Transcript_11939/m.25112 type:complete len:324 (-) Transcript_11939:1499-2470(-)